MIPSERSLRRGFFGPEMASLRFAGRLEGSFERQHDHARTDPVDFGKVYVTVGGHPWGATLGAGAGKREAAFGNDGGKEGYC